MTIKNLKVRLERKKGPFSATVVQYSSEGEVSGRNLLAGRSIMLEDSAKDAVRYALGPGVEEVEFEVIDHETT